MTTIDTDGTRNFHRGCAKDKIHQSFYCNTKSNLDLKNKTEKVVTGLYHTECCKENLCNNGSFPFLPGPNQEPESKYFKQKQFFFNFLKILCLTLQFVQIRL